MPYAHLADCLDQDYSDFGNSESFFTGLPQKALTVPRKVRLPTILKIL